MTRRVTLVVRKFNFSTRRLEPHDRREIIVEKVGRYWKDSGGRTYDNFGRQTDGSRFVGQKFVYSLILEEE